MAAPVDLAATAGDMAATAGDMAAALDMPAPLPDDMLRSPDMQPVDMRTPASDLSTGGTGNHDGCNCSVGSGRRADLGGSGLLLATAAIALLGHRLRRQRTRSS
jgi:hypothetical protein